jgi:hypothetical protein
MNTSVSLHEIDDVVKDLKALKKQTGLPKETQDLITTIANTVSRWQSTGRRSASAQQSAADRLSKFPRVDTGSDFST